MWSRLQQSPEKSSRRRSFSAKNSYHIFVTLHSKLLTRYVGGRRVRSNFQELKKVPPSRIKKFLGPCTVSAYERWLTFRSFGFERWSLPPKMRRIDSRLTRVQLSAHQWRTNKMCKKLSQYPLCYIIPSHIHENIARNGSERQKELAYQA